MKYWKQAERRVAAVLGGERVPVSGRQRGYAPDIEHPALSVEVKARATFPAWIEDALRQAEASSRDGKTPVCVLHRDRRPYRDDLVVIRLSHFARMFTRAGLPGGGGSDESEAGKGA